MAKKIAKPTLLCGNWVE